MSRPSFKSVIRPDLNVRRVGGRTEVSKRDALGSLTYVTDKTNKHTAAYLNSKFPTSVIVPPQH